MSLIKSGTIRHPLIPLSFGKLFGEVIPKWIPGHIVQLVKYLTLDTCLTADPGVASSILARSHTLVEINHEIISRAILLPSSDSRRLAVIYKVN